MHKYDALLSINPKKVENLAEYISYCKYYFKPKTYEEVGDYLENKDKCNLLDIIKKDFGFIRPESESQLDDLLRKLKNYKTQETTKDFPLSWLKNEILKKSNKEFKIENDHQLADSVHISGIFSYYDGASNYVKKLLRYSFIVHAKFILRQPYFSKDDDEFYIIQNPVLKEWVFKVPMVRGSSWKGALASVFADLPEAGGIEDRQQCVGSYFRIFGVGSESINTLKDSIENRLHSDGNVESLKSKLVEILIFELGINLDKVIIEKIRNVTTEDEIIGIIGDIFSREDEVTEKSKFLNNITTRRGRAVFYPTYFDCLSLEIINPHNRKDRAGSGPIHFEVVPAGTEGILQIVYIPFDAVLLEENAVKNEVKRDLISLLSAIERLSQRGIGAKTKLGWGTFELKEKHCYINGKLGLDDNFDVKGWSICQY